MNDRSRTKQKEDDKPTTAGGVTTSIRIAPQSVSERNDRRAVRSRRRRERPQKLMDVGGGDGQGEATVHGYHIYQPDIESFVSNCIPGLSFTAGSSDSVVSQRRSKLIRKRSLPLLSFLSSTHLAAAEKKRKKEEQERQNAIAEEEAKKALLLNPIESTTAAVKGESFVSDAKSSTTASKAQLGEGNAVNVASNIQPAGVDNTQNTPTATVAKTPTVTRKMEQTSNILMPPLLKVFLKQLDNCNPGQT